MAYDYIVVYWIWGAIVMLIAIGVVFVLRSGYSQGVRVLSRETKLSYVFSKGKMKHERFPPRDKVVVGQDSYDLPEGIKPMLVKTNPKSNKYNKFFYEENGQLLGPPSSMAEPFTSLMRPKDLAEEGERKSLAWLTRVTTDKMSIMEIILGVAIGLGLGYMVFTNWHPGLVTAPPSGYQYIVQKINETVTSTIHS